MEPRDDLERSRADLEWSTLLGRMAQGAVSEPGRRRVLELLPASSSEVCSTRLGVMAEVLDLFQSGERLPRRAVADIEGSVARAEKLGVLSGEELFSISRTLDVALDISRFVKAHQQTHPLLYRSMTVEPELGPLARDLALAIEEGGRVRDQASPNLEQVRREILSLRRQIQAKVGELVQRYRDALQDTFFAERDGRFVLPVRADAPYRIEGVMLDTSASGATLYVEPKELSALGNRLRFALAEEEREEELVRRRLSALVAPLAESVRWASDVTIRADMLSSLAEYARRTRARVCPLAESGSFFLRGARHPILADVLEVVVPFDAELSGGGGVILSGPNAGGKTVALKTLGLFALMQATGLPLPSDEGTSVGYFEAVYSDIGDDQSLSQSLSTFSGHVERVARTLAATRSGVLVLFDELMGGTDPNEGAALAIALAEEFARRGGTVVITTHYEALKTWNESDARFQCAAVGFDFDRMLPTFRVSWGRAGASSALYVAERFGLPHVLMERARALMPELVTRIEMDRRKVEALLVELEAQQRELREEIERQRLITASVERERDRLKEAKRRALEDESDALRVAVRDARRAVDKVKSSLKGATKETLGELDATIQGAARMVAIGSTVDKELREPRSRTFDLAQLDLKPGMTVHIKSLGVDGEVLAETSKGSVRILVGAMKLSVALSDIGPPLKGTSSKVLSRPKAGSFAKEETPELSLGLEVPLKTEDVVLDLRGLRVEPALSELDTFLDELIRRCELGGYVLHGHGTGAMKDAVRRHLAVHPAIVHARPADRGEGGDAFTVVWVGPR